MIYYTKDLDKLINTFAEVADDMKNKLHSGEFSEEEVNSFCASLQPLVDNIKKVYYDELTVDYFKID